MQNYMLTVLVKNDLDEKARVALLEAIKKQFDNLGKEDLWGTRTLAYPIQHLDKAYFAHFEFAAQENKISALDKSIKLNEDVIRYLLLRKEDKKIRPFKGKKAIIEAKNEDVAEEKNAEEVKTEIKE